MAGEELQSGGGQDPGRGGGRLPEQREQEAPLPGSPKEHSQVSPR